MIGEHADAALLDLGRDRVLGVVDEVAVEVLGDQPLRLGLHPGGDEGRQVAVRVPLERQFLVDQTHPVERRHAAGGELVVGSGLGEEAAAEEHRGIVAAGGFFHAASLCLAQAVAVVTSHFGPTPPGLMTMVVVATATAAAKTTAARARRFFPHRRGVKRLAAQLTR
jgi:hypothetical protein